MKSVYEAEINVPQVRLFNLFADPRNDKEWMEGLVSYEPVKGQPGMPGSEYRLVQQDGNMAFHTTVLSREEPDLLEIVLDGANVIISITARFSAISPETTRFISEEVFTFRGWANKASGFLLRKDIKSIHHRQMESFKRYAESHR